MRCDRVLKTVAAQTLIGLVAFASANNGTISMETFPSIAVADGRSNITISALIRDSNGRLVPDGTQVVFDSSLGAFRDKVVKTSNGYARAILVAGSIPGFARVRASALTFSASAEIEVEFVSDRELLNSAKEYFEIVGKESLVYSQSDRVIEASGQKGGAELRFRDIVVEADDLQVRIPSYEVKARRAKLTIRGQVYEFDELYYQLNKREGLGVGTFTVPVHDPSAVGRYTIPIKPKQITAVVNITRSGLQRITGQFDRRRFDFSDISQSTSMVEAKKVIAFPRREIQFQDANVIVGGQSIMKLPLFRVNINDSSPLVTEQFLNISNNDVAINYPHYLTLKPGETSALVFRYGNRYGTGAGAGGGAFIDYQLNWNRGDEMDGGMTFFGLGREDWGAGVRQSWSFDGVTNINTQLDFPAHKSMYASANVSHSFPGYNVSLNGNHGRSISGGKLITNNANLVVEKDPLRTGLIPGNVFFGVRASQSHIITNATDQSNNNVGIQARFVSDTFRPARNSSVNASYTVARNSGTNSTKGLTHFASMTYSTMPTNGLIFNLNYDFTEDGFTSNLLGRHKVSLESFYTIGSGSVTAFMTRSLDIDRLNLNAKLNYRFGPLWRFSYGYFFDQFGPDSFQDQSLIFSYKLGIREVGLSYSQRTKRIGIELLGTSF